MLNVIIIGVGNLGLKRANLISNNKIFNIVALVDNKKKKYIKNKKLNKINFYKNYTAIDLNKIEINLAIVSANPVSAFKIAKYFLENKINVFLEKPPCNKFSLYKILYKLALRKKLLLKVGFNFIYDEGLQYVKSIIKKNTYGNIYSINADYLYGTAKSNKNHVGSLMDVGIHLFYISQFLINDYSPSYGFLFNNEIEENIDDNGLIILKSKNNYNFNIFFKFSFINWENNFYYNIIFEKGIIKIKGLPKWGKQEISFGKRVLPSGKPNYKKKFFYNDNSFQNELIDLKKILKNKNTYATVNKKDYNILILMKKTILKCKNNKLVKYFDE